eukprot:s1844_g3.t1
MAQADAGAITAVLQQIAEATQAAVTAAQAAQQFAVSASASSAATTASGGAGTAKAQLAQRTDEPNKELNIDTGPLEARQRSAKLYGLLAGLVKNRALSIVRAAPPGNGFEALRTTLADDLKSAVLLRCVTGALKTHLYWGLRESSKYDGLREEILRWERAHQKWSNLVSAADDSNSEVKPMEVDRIEGKGKYSDKGKGKADKGNAKGKSKQKNKDKGKSKGSYDKGGNCGKGKSAQSQGKGKGGKNEKVCFICNKPGHFAQDCWNAVRNVQASSSAGGSNQSDWTNLTSVSQQGGASAQGASKELNNSSKNLSNRLSFEVEHGLKGRVLPHEAGVKVRLELQSMSMTVKGWVRVMSSSDVAAVSPRHKLQVCAVKADVFPDVRLDPAGRNLDESNCGIGRRYFDHFQDLTLFRPQRTGKLDGTTLIRDAGHCYVLRLCESLETLVDLGAEIYGHEGPRGLLATITDSEKDPMLMGFALMDDELPLFPDVERQHASEVTTAPEDEVVGLEIEDGDAGSGGADVPLEGRILFEPSPTDMVLVNGVELTPSSTLAALKAGCKYYSLSTSGSKAKCFTRLLNHQKS